MAGKLKKLRIETVFDLLYHVPSRYEDRSTVSSANRITPGSSVTLVGSITEIKNDFTRRGKFLQKGIFSDSTGSIPVIWFNQPFLVSALKNQSVALWGKVDFYASRPALISPDYELTGRGGELLHLGRLVPIYPETAGVSSKWLRTKIHHLLTNLDLAEILPPGILPADYPSFSVALNTIHFPKSLSETEIARTRLGFDELLLLHLASLKRRAAWKHTRLSKPLTVNSGQITAFTDSLPFKLTSSQKQAVFEILSDLSRPVPMNRLLEGEVGSGKTVVAAAAAFAAFTNHTQTVFLAPTQILAEQHYQTLTRLLSPHGLTTALVTSQHKPPRQYFDILVGTHALLSPHLDLSRVGLTIIDEQHRFGVIQRAQAAALGASPHTLTMTATPIPRSLALTLFGDLDLSLLTEIPKDRPPVKTWVIPEAKRAAAYTWISTQISTHHSQAFIICPLIEYSETLTSVKAAATEFAALKDIFPQFRLGLLHGRLAGKAKSEVMDLFRQGDLDILVATPVVEVGIDVPNAALIVIEAADRFGLAQLHQLRGRVGRGNLQSYCLIFTTDNNPRLKLLETHHSGLELAELDLKLRGPGEVYGTAQHGLPQLKVGSFADLNLLNLSRLAAEKCLPLLKPGSALSSLIRLDPSLPEKSN